MLQVLMCGLTFSVENDLRQLLSSVKRYRFEYGQKPRKAFVSECTGKWLSATTCLKSVNSESNLQEREMATKIPMSFSIKLVLRGERDH